MQPLKSTEAYQLTQTVRHGRGRSCSFNEVWQYAASDSSDTPQNRRAQCYCN